MSQAKVRQRWHRELRKLKLPFAGPLHAIRHSGPSEDLARGLLSLEAVRRRGRWKSLDSVQRYTKTFALTRFRARTPDDTAELARKVALDIRGSLLAALCAPCNKKNELAKTLATHLQARRCEDNNSELLNNNKADNLPKKEKHDTK